MRKLTYDEHQKQIYGTSNFPFEYIKMFAECQRGQRKVPLPSQPPEKTIPEGSENHTKGTTNSVIKKEGLSVCCCPCETN